MRDRLKSLIDTFFASVDIDKFYSQNQKEKLSDYLLANGVIVPPYKPGDTVYVIYEGDVTSAEVLAIYIDHDGGMFDLKIREKTETVNGFCTTINNDYTFDDVYRTKEEAEQALKGGAEE